MPSAAAADHRRALAGAEHLLGSIGKPAFGVDLRLVDELGHDVPRGEVGEIISRSDAVMSGYLEMPEETARAIRDGWLWGDDLARMDDNGYIDPAKLGQHCRQRLAAYKVPEVVEVIGEMPLNASGKILKRELRVRAAR
jgi:acyl-CoA synthetase (AMP-forming)/AMP-acid ligase II